ncbi:hypothetical protein JMK10_19355 [Rhodovulum sulfidophilum]|uniref:hypothetical protein n=1 Tax=Rhodovulum sulfidophilum TaxID=35806 RepID=UPI00192099C9|nr:hypothetical protein [Rhodovulum sulfidophilum]MBL3576378.1 hypothetical protein [Rhodovulum sulfidophilum]MCE8433814.1 hypothetical protein [Rhodovulum sulfidophilum]MCF4118885.1 hypothetical protein [Rhodovulum sulfidophilum]
MTRPIYIESLRRMVAPFQYALLERLRDLYPSSRLDVDDAGFLRSPKLGGASDLVSFHEFLERNRSQELRMGRCNWLDNLGKPPVDGGLEDAQAWVDEAVKTVNEQLRQIEMFED